MNRKQLTILLFAGIVLGGAGLHFYKARKESYVSKDAVTGQKLVPNFPLNDVARLTINRGPTSSIWSRQTGLESARTPGLPGQFSKSASSPQSLE